LVGPEVHWRLTWKASSATSTQSFGKDQPRLPPISFGGERPFSRRFRSTSVGNRPESTETKTRSPGAAPPSVGTLESSAPSHRRSSFPPTLYLSRRRAILSAFSCRCPTRAHSCVSPRRARLRRWIDPSRCFPCARDKSSGAPTTIHHGAFLFTALDAATGEVIERSLSASSRTRVPELPVRDRAPCPARTRSAPDHGQRRHPQDADDPKVARRATEIACPLHRPPALG
jgi:hypothetical protein